MDNKDAPEASRADDVPAVTKIFSILAGAIGGLVVQLFIVSLLEGSMPSNAQEIISGLLYTPAMMDPVSCAIFRALIGGLAGYLVQANPKLRQTKASFVIIAAFFAGFVSTGVVTFCADTGLAQ